MDVQSVAPYSSILTAVICEPLLFIMASGMKTECFYYTFKIRKSEKPTDDSVKTSTLRFWKIEVFHYQFFNATVYLGFAYLQGW